jgi:hypothetical protein
VTLTVRRHFLTWFATAVVLGAMPWLVNLFVQWISANMTFESVCRVPELMYFVITLNATCILDLLGRKRTSNATLLWLMASLLLIIAAALFLGVVAYQGLNPSTSGPFKPIMDRLIKASLTLSLAALVITVIMQLQLMRAADSDEASNEAAVVGDGR